jgi:hypothetical protein
LNKHSENTENYWYRQKVIDGILDIYYSDHDPASLNVDYIPMVNFNLYQAGIRFFGKWPNAVKAAGLNYDELEILNSDDEPYSKYLDEEVIIKRIVMLHNAGEDLSSKHIAEVYPHLWRSASSRRNFGTWGRAVVAAGLDYNDILNRRNRIWNYEHVVKTIYEIYSSTGDLSHEYILEEHPMLLKASKKYFDNWENAIEQIGIKMDRVKYDIAMEPFRIFLLKNYSVEIFKLIEKEIKPFRKVYPDIAQNNLDKSDPVPSFIDTSNGVWVDIQLRSWKRGLEDELNLFLTRTEHIKVYYLLGEPRKWYQDKVIFICYKDLFPSLVEKGREDLIRDLNFIERGRVPDKFIEQYNEYVARSKEHQST